MLANYPPLLVLLLEAAGMFVVTYICGVVPLYLSLSKTKLRILEVMGAGLLVGASMTVVLPEGVAALFTSDEEGSAMHAHGHHHHRRQVAAEAHAEHAHIEEAQAYDPAHVTGVAVLCGFLLMFLIDQIATPGAHIHVAHGAPDVDLDNCPAHRYSGQYSSSHRTEAMRLMRASSLRFSTVLSGDSQSSHQPTASPRIGHSRSSEDANETRESPARGRETANDDTSIRRTASPLSSNGHNGQHGRKGSSVASSMRESAASSHRGGIRSAIASVAGLMIHAMADGIAMGASAGSGNEGLKVIVLFAIMVHKAPAAFGLCALLLGQRLHKSDIRKAIAIFSLATPTGAILSYLFLALVLPYTSAVDGQEPSSRISSHHIGAALTFSAGTFIYVAMHAVNELASVSADYDADATLADASASDALQRSQAHAHGDSRLEQGAYTPLSPSVDVAPKQILGRFGRIVVFVLGTLLPKGLQMIVGHGH